MVGAVDFSLQPVFFTLLFLKVHICNSASSDYADLLHCLQKPLSFSSFFTPYQIVNRFSFVPSQNFSNFNQVRKKLTYTISNKESEPNLAGWVGGLIMRSIA